MPTGCVLDRADWDLVAELCAEHDLWLVHDAAMERLLFDGRPLVHPAGLPGMAERTITVGAASKELRMIGWRVGWTVAPTSIVDDIGLVAISNVVCQVGIAQDAVAVALEAGDDDVLGLRPGPGGASRRAARGVGRAGRCRRTAAGRC